MLQMDGWADFFNKQLPPLLTCRCFSSSCEYLSDFAEFWWYTFASSFPTINVPPPLRYSFLSASCDSPPVHHLTYQTRVAHGLRTQT